MSREDMMLKAIQTYNMICELESDISMGIKKVPDGLDEELMKDTKDKCLEVIYK